MSQWKRAGAQSPCPICRKSSWCSVSSDGAVVSCMRESNASYHTDVNSQGEAYYLHRINDRDGSVKFTTHPDRAIPRRLDRDSQW